MIIGVQAAALHDIGVGVKIGTATVDAMKTTATIPLTLSLTDAGKHPIYILGTSYSVVGRVAHRATVALADDGAHTQLATSGTYNNGVAIDSYVLIATGQFVPAGNSMEAGDEADVDRSIVVGLPVSFDEIVVNVAAVTLRKDRARQMEPTRHRNSTRGRRRIGTHQPG